LVRPDRYLFQELLYVGPGDAVRVELRRHHVAVEHRYCQQVRQIMIRLFLSLNDFVHAVEAASGEVVGHAGHVRLDRNDFGWIQLVLLDEFDHTVNRGLRVDHGVVLFDRALKDALIVYLVPVALKVNRDTMKSSRTAGPLRLITLFQLEAAARHAS
jgi:hypothetical protein